MPTVNQGLLFYLSLIHSYLLLNLPSRNSSFLSVDDEQHCEDI